MAAKPDMQAAEGRAAYATTSPEQRAFFKIPARFDHVPVAEEPRGYDRDELFPNGLSRLFFGDCLHAMRVLPSECIDLIYIDPPCFSGRNYNIIALPEGSGEDLAPSRSAALAWHVEPRTDITLACRVQDDLGGEGVQAMKLKVE